MKKLKQIPGTCMNWRRLSANSAFSTVSRTRDIAPFILAILPTRGSSCTYMYTQCPAIQRPAGRLLPAGSMLPAAERNVHHFSRWDSEAARPFPAAEGAKRNGSQRIERARSMPMSEQDRRQREIQ